MKQVASSVGDNGYKWEDVRSCNYFFDNVLPKYEAGEISRNQDNVRHYIGEMYVNRAYIYYQMLVKYGDLPIVTTALPDIEDELMKASNVNPVIRWRVLLSKT